MATHCSVLAWRSPWTVEAGGYSPWGLKESDMTEISQHTHEHARTNNTATFKRDMRNLSKRENVI